MGCVSISMFHSFTFKRRNGVYHFASVGKKTEWEEETG